jgi:hypothetical protein
MKPDYPLPDQINRAFQLAFVVLVDKELALRAVSGALMNRQIISRLQHRRTYYKANNSRKVAWRDEDLLKLLAMSAAEPYEKSQELEWATQSRTLTSEDLIIRYVKQIVLQAMSHSSFYATVGICRLLYSYTHRQTREIYDWLVPGEGAFKDDSAFRRAKMRLSLTLHERFSAFLANSNMSDPPISQSESYFNEMVERALAIFAPQIEGCPPDSLFHLYQFDAANIGLSELKHRDDSIERTRMHIVICPSCFSKLNQRLANPPPSEQLSLPRFCTSAERLQHPQTTNNQQLPVAGHAHLPDLTFKDYCDIVR